MTAIKLTFPSCWSDDERMAVLFAPFRVREVNPENYESKMKFWQDMVELYCTQAGTVIFNKLSIQTAFARGSSVPYGLDTVIDEMMRTKKIRLRTEYDPQNGWTSWAMNGILWRPLSWSIFKLKSLIGYEEQKAFHAQIEYVHLAAIENYCKKLQSEVLENHFGKLMHYSDLRKLVETAGIQLNQESLVLCLRTLHCQRSLVLENKNDSNDWQIHLVKIPATKDKGSLAITETDYAIHNLQMTKKNLLNQIEDLEAQITTVTDKARQYLKENKRQMAKNHLRKKRLLETSYEKRSVALHNIEELLNSVNEAQSHGEILDAYKIGSRALQTVLNTSGLRYDNVDEVIADVRETLDSQREVVDAMANIALTDASLSATENHELERELKALFEEGNVSSSIPTSVNEDTPAASKMASTRPVTISDQELLAMLDQLEVEDKSPDKSKRLSS